MSPSYSKYRTGVAAVSESDQRPHNRYSSNFFKTAGRARWVFPPSPPPPLFRAATFDRSQATARALHLTPPLAAGVPLPTLRWPLSALRAASACAQFSRLFNLLRRLTPPSPRTAPPPSTGRSSKTLRAPPSFPGAAPAAASMAPQMGPPPPPEGEEEPLRAFQLAISPPAAIARVRSGLPLWHNDVQLWRRGGGVLLRLAT